MNKTMLLFLVILIEGYVVLACELLAIRQSIPFVGSGAETISIIISAVLLPLAIGYHHGGQSFHKKYQQAKAQGKRPKSIRNILLSNIINALLILSIGLSYAFLEFFFGILGGIGLNNRLMMTACYSIMFLVLPIYLLGQTLPLVSNYFSARNLSEITGKMLFFSTTGSFLGSVFSTIVLMSTIGVHNTVIVTLSLLFVLSLLLGRRGALKEKVHGVLIMIVLVGLNSPAMMRGFEIVNDNAYNIISVRHNDKEDVTSLYVNRAGSSRIAKDPEKNYPVHTYIQENFIDTLPTDSKRDILIIGAAGFTLGLPDMFHNYTYVDIDKDMKEVAERDFLKRKLSPNKVFAPASARAFVRHNKKQYDLIVLDVFTNVHSIPMECTTREFMLDVKKALKPNGIFIANNISSATFHDKFSMRFYNTFASVFPGYSRQIVTKYNPWADDNSVSNVEYIYFNKPVVEDRTLYTDDRNTFSFDRD